MPNRIFSQSKAPQPSFGLVGWLEQTRVRLPLKGVECRFRVCGELVDVEVDQLFHQNNAQALNCVYSFPLPAGAAVYRCEMHVNGRVLRARVEEENRAREIAREQQAAGHRTALVEMQRDNLFTLSLGNLQPQDLVVIRFAYFQTLTRLADWTSLRIPVCPGVRYLPGRPLLRAPSGRGAADDTDQVPDASRISPPRIDTLHPDAAYFCVEGRVEDPDESLSDVSSASHPLLVDQTGGAFQVKLADRGAVPDSDFALRWSDRSTGELRSAAWVYRAGNETYALVRLQAPRLAPSAETPPHDYYFLVDRSGSMKGLKWKKAVQALRAFLNLLGPHDRVWMTFFSSDWLDFAEEPMSVAAWAADGGASRLEEIGADGGTEMLPALRHLLQHIERHSPNRAASVILITDGQVGNEPAILDALRPHPGLHLHAFGIDTTVNDALLTRLASQQRGSCCLLQPTDDIVGAVARLSNRLRQPAFTSVRVADGWELPRQASFDLHSEECLVLSLKGTAVAKEVEVQGQRPDGGQQAWRVPLRECAEPALELLWAKGQIESLLDSGKSSAAIALAKKHNLVCRGTAFIAWDEQEQVAVAQRELYQPNIKVQSSLYNRRHYRRHVGRQLAEVDTQFAEYNARLVKGDAIRIERWRVEFRAACAALEARMRETLANEFLVWTLQDEAHVKSRMDALERLLGELRRSAQDPASILATVEAWAQLESAPLHTKRGPSKAQAGP
jgi:Ca-activated chloride channel family protein